MKINLIELMPIQQEVNDVVIKRLGRKVSIDEYILAFNVELFEYFNAIGTWKWWKQSHKQDREKILDELADCFAFFLSVLLRSDEVMEERGKNKMSKTAEREVEDTLNLLFKRPRKRQHRYNKLINSWITMIACDHETEDNVFTTQRFSVAIF